MNILGHELLIERGRYVEQEILDHKNFFGEVCAYIEQIIKSPDDPRFTQRGVLSKFRRIRMTDDRVYIRVWGQAKVVTILAVVRRSTVKREEKGGALDYEFQKYLQRHTDFLPDRFIPFLSPQEKVAQQAYRFEDALPPKYSAISFEPPPVVFNSTPIPKPVQMEDYIVSGKPLTEEEAEAILRTCWGALPLDPYCMRIIAKLNRAEAGDRVLMELPAGLTMNQKDKIQKLQTEIRRTLHYYSYEYAVRLDELSQKFILVPPDKVNVYCSNTRGRKTRLTV